LVARCLLIHILATFGHFVKRNIGKSGGMHKGENDSGREMKDFCRECAGKRKNVRH
jgi:hypothetical protein